MREKEENDREKKGWGKKIGERRRVKKMDGEKDERKEERR